MTSRMIGIAILETIMGAIVVYGGIALIYFVGNLVLGGTHALLGLAAFPASYALWTGRIWARNYSIIINSVITVFSTASEIIVISGPASAQVFVGSIVGTLVAITLCLAVIYSLRTSAIRVLFAAPVAAAIKPRESREDSEW